MAQQTAESIFGAQVRGAREARNWTQEQLRKALLTASGIDLSPTAMTRLEQGKRPIRLNEVAALAEVLDISLDRYSGPAAQVSRQEYERALSDLAEMTDKEYALVDQLRRLEAQQHVLVGQLNEVRQLRHRLQAAVADYNQALKVLSSQVKEDGGRAH